MANCLVHPSHSEKHGAKIVLGHFIVRLDLHHLLQLGRRFVKASHQ
jgi:hypothetical protein